MRKLTVVFLLSAGIVPRAMGNPPDLALEYQEEVFDIAAESNILGTADQCGFVSDSFGMTASMQMVMEAMKDAQTIWPGKPGELSQTGQEAFKNALVELEAAHANGEKDATYQSCQNFQESGGIQALLKVFPNTSH